MTIAFRSLGRLVSAILILIVLAASVGFSLQEFSVVPSNGSIIYPQNQVIFRDGFETGDFSGWTGVAATQDGRVAVVSMDPYDGWYSGLFEADGVESGTSRACSRFSLQTPQSEIYVRGYFYIANGLPLDDDGDRFGLITLQVGNSILCSFRVYRDVGVDKFSVVGFDGDGNFVSETTDAVYPAQKQWYCIELYARIHETQGEYRAWINGVEQIEIAGANSAVLGDINEVRWGLPFTINTQHSVEVHGDCAAISTSYIGPKDILKDGFESGDFGTWSGTYMTAGENISISTAKPYEGVSHAIFQTAAIVSGVKYAYCYQSLPITRNEIYVRGYFYIANGLPLDDDGDRFGLITLQVGSQLQCTFRVSRSNGVSKFGIVGYNGTETIQTTTDAVYPAQKQWYCIELYARIHETQGEYRAWINGVEQIEVSNLNTAAFGVGLTNVRFGLTYTANVQRTVQILCDCAVLSAEYIGPILYPFGVIGQSSVAPAVSNFYWLFGNQSIKFRTISPSELTSIDDLSSYHGLILFTKGDYAYDASIIRQFARSRVVISHIWDFCNILYPSLKDKTEIVTTNTVRYVRDWGNFRKDDLVEMRNETGNSNKLTTVLSSGLSSFGNTSYIAQYNSTRIAFFHMNGTRQRSGIYVMDMDATDAESEWTGMWHLFPALKIVKDFYTGKYSRWMGNGQNWQDLTWIQNRISTLVAGNSDIARSMVIGQSVQGRNISAIVVGKGTRIMIIDGCIHGNEKTTAFASLRIAELLIEYYRSSLSWQRKLSQYTVIIVPVLNPDGFVANTRDNANSVDLNRNFPPAGSSSQPETKALVDLMRTNSPTIYVNNHEGYIWYPNDLFYSYYQVEPYTTFTAKALQQANSSFVSLNHWGWFTEGNSTVGIGEVRRIRRSGLTNSAQAYAAWKYNASTLLAESILWSPTWGDRKCLWGIEYYCTMSIALLEHYDQNQAFLITSDGFITGSTSEASKLSLSLDTSELLSSSTTIVSDLQARGKPLLVLVDGLQMIEGIGWKYSNKLLTITGAARSIEIFYTG